MDIVVSQSGRVHRRNCRHRGRSAPWEWAASAERAVVIQAVAENGYAVCQHCRPFSLEKDQAAQAAR